MPARPVDSMGRECSSEVSTLSIFSSSSTAFKVLITSSGRSSGATCASPAAFSSWASTEWGRHVLACAAERFGEIPDLFVTGRETRRIDWFDCPQGAGMAQLYIPKTIDISASEMRRFLMENDRASWERYTDPALWEAYGRLRELALASAGNTETDSI